jgi:hypothetical protein
MHVVTPLTFDNEFHIDFKKKKKQRRKKHKLEGNGNEKVISFEAHRGIICEDRSSMLCVYLGYISLLCQWLGSLISKLFQKDSPLEMVTRNRLSCPLQNSN